MKQTWHKLSTIGVRSGYDLRDAKTIVSLNRINFVLIFFVVSSVLVNLILGAKTFLPVLFIHLCIFAAVYFICYLGYHFAAKSVLLLASISLLSYMLTHGGEGSGLNFYFVSLIVLPAVLFRRMIPMIFFQLLIVGALIFTRYYYYGTLQPAHSPAIAYKVFFIINSFYSSLLVAIGILFFKNASTRNEDELIKKNQQTEIQNKELLEANLELKRVNADLEQFAYVSSHDLKEPLRMIASYSQLLTRKIGDDLQTQEFSGFILKGVNRMQQLINDLLVYTQIIHKEEHFSKVDPANTKARDYLVKFSDLLRYQVYDSTSDNIPLEKEIAYLKSYMELQKTRKEDNLRVSVNIDESMNGVKVPPMLFIPFVENAFKYVSNKEKEANSIELKIVQTGRELTFRLSNTYESQKAHSTSEKGIGIQNVKRQLELLYPDKHSLRIFQEDSVFIVDLAIEI